MADYERPQQGVIRAYQSNLRPDRDRQDTRPVAFRPEISFTDRYRILMDKQR